MNVVRAGQAFVFVAALAARLIQRSPCAAVTFALVNA